MNNREIVVDNFSGGGEVCPPIPTALVRANLTELCERKSA